MPWLCTDKQVLRGPARGTLLRWQRGDRQGRESVQRPCLEGVRPQREGVGGECAALLGQPSQLCCVHCSLAATCTRDGLGPSERGASDSRLLHREEEDLCDLYLFRVLPLQGAPR